MSEDGLMEAVIEAAEMAAAHSGVRHACADGKKHQMVIIVVLESGETIIFDVLQSLVDSKETTWSQDFHSMLDRCLAC